MNNYEQKEGFPWGCLLGGCAGIFVLMLIGGGATAFLGYNYVSGQIDQYTSREPRNLPSVVYTDEQMTELRGRLEWVEGEGETAEQIPAVIELTEDDINALIGQEEDLRGKVHVAIEDGQITGEVSFPLDEIPGGDGRYFNGAVTLSASVENGKPVVRIEDARVDGQPVPEQLLGPIKQANFAEDASIKVNGRKLELESIVIQDDKVVVTHKASQAEIDESSLEAATEIE